MNNTIQEKPVAVKTDDLSEFCSRSFWENLNASGSSRLLVTENLLEFATPRQTIIIAENVFEFLCVGGIWRIAVPDANNPSEIYRYWYHPDVIKQNIWEFFGKRPNKVFFNITSLSLLLESIGFTVRPLEFYDAEGKLHLFHWDFHSGLINKCAGKSLSQMKFFPNFNSTSLIVEAIKFNFPKEDL